jgi:hypothetical protein
MAPTAKRTISLLNQLRLATLYFGTIGLALSGPKGESVTFHRDILPILQKHCQSCHRPGEIAPMSFLTYSEARPWAKAIRSAVVQKKMPPWLSDPRFGKFANDRSLSQDEIQRLVAWSDNGAPEGNPSDAPKPVEFASGWNIGKPDLILEMPKDFQVPPTGDLPYQYIVFPTGLTEDKWVEKIEMRPGNRSVVHHAIASVISRDSAYLKRATIGDFLDPEEFSEKIRSVNGQEPSQFSSPSDSSEVLQVYLPGGDPVTMGPGQAKLIKAGSYLRFQLHYTTVGKATSDRTRIGFVFAKQPPRERLATVSVQNFAFSIPAMADNYPIRAEAVLQQDVRVVSYTPHMHLRGKSFQYKAYYPSGESEMLLFVPRWNFDWQLTYILAEPKLLPKGTRLETIGYYDNSPNNRFNPNAKAEVVYGEQTWNEMMGGLMEVTLSPDSAITPLFKPVAKTKVNPGAEKKDAAGPGF